ncbi:MAG: lysylphosphatidylglycerol synthase transmembrane domain-containing protein [Flavobacteriales bacterium]
MSSELNEEQSPDLKNELSPKKALLPILIGITASILLYYFKFESNTFSKVTWDSTTLLYGLGGILIFITSHLCLTYRFKLLTNHEISLKSSLIVSFLFMFATAILPALLASTGVLYILLRKERVNKGKSITVTLLSSFLDRIFFLTGLTYILLYLKANYLNHIELRFDNPFFRYGLTGALWFGYLLLGATTYIYAYGLFVSAKKVKKYFYKIFSLPILNKWKRNSLLIADEMNIANDELKKRSGPFWIKILFLTFAMWLLRFYTVNMLVMAFSPPFDQIVVLSKQLIIQILMITIPTPGGSGTAEFTFSGLLETHIPNGAAPLLAVLWRVITYYPYIIIGLIILPKWINKSFVKTKTA